MSRCLMWKKEDSKPEGISGNPATPASTATSPSPATPSTPSPSGALPTSSHAAACISQGIKIKGEVTGSEDLFVDGVVEGKLSLTTNCCLTIGPNGHVKADVLAREVIVRGKIEGKVTGRDKVQLWSSGERQVSRAGVLKSRNGGRLIMSFLHKLGLGMGSGTSRGASLPVHSNSRARTPGAPISAVGATRTPESPGSTRVSNGLKEFLWNLDGLGRGALLDLGPASQTTLNFFIERGFRVSSEDILRGWKAFLTEEEARLREDADACETLDMTPSGRATRFLVGNLQYPRASFDAVLLWDLLDYLEPMLVKQMVANLTELLRPGGVILALFHSKKPEGFQRYRVADSHTLQVISSAIICPAQKVYQNREIQDLFARYRTMKSFVGRDQLRETLFIK